ncbi:hypothetical protein CRG98_011611 [Punica granatum]|uniref:Uncharacterized protein n=1 Tax=Punica granatum TaxID=22663 RepID=A0A2I0KHM3_PUNGR|nr:hypothetical protein CRG98_011611 [Punica granatum]
MGLPARSRCRSKNGPNPPSAMATDLLPGQYTLSFKCSFTFVRISKQALGMNEPFKGHLNSLEDALLVLSDLSYSHGYADYRRRAIHGFTPPRELLSGLSPYTSTGKRLDAEVPPFLRSRRQKRLSESHVVNTTVSVDNKHGPRGKVRPSTSRAPILLGAPSTGVTTHGRRRRLHKASDTDHEDRDIRIQHSCQGNLDRLRPRANLVLLFLDDRGNHL